jgi:hypothetical protein
MGKLRNCESPIAHDTDASCVEVFARASHRAPIPGNYPQ